MLAQQQLASVWELQWGSLWLTPTVAVLGAALGLLGGGGLALAERAENQVFRGALASATSAFGGVVAWGVGGGRHLATWSTRGGFALGVAATAGVVVWLVAPHLRRWLRERPIHVAAAAALGILVVELANRFVLVRLYPAFHLGLAATALLLAPAVAAGIPVVAASESLRVRRVWLGLGVLVGLTLTISLGVATWASARLTHFDNFRLFVSDQAPIGGQAVRLAAWLAPPVLVEGGEICPQGEKCAGETQAASFNLTDRDLLLISIDAVRADHVGCYGYVRPTTPHIDALAAEGVRFEHAYCATPHTSYSVTSLMTGKYMRPLLLQGAGQDSDTWAGLLRRYGYRTAGFYPPALFFIDARHFEGFRDRYLDFEYRKFEFLEGPPRVRQVAKYLALQPATQRLFVWVHLFGPHEPYEAHPEYPFGDRDMDRYDSEIAAADATVGQLVALFRRQRPQGVVVVTSDHGEEFGDHGGRYHGTTVYEEQVRVPLVVSAPELLQPRAIREPVQTIDLLPTVLAALDIPRPPRLRGRDIGGLLTGEQPEGQGLALAETEEQAMLAAGDLRLVCARRLGACQLFDIRADPKQTHNVADTRTQDFRKLRRRLQELSASHGQFEARGLRAEGKGWPEAILRAVAGDGDAADDVAALLDDADQEIRRKAAEVLFNLHRESTAPALRLTLSRDEDEIVRRWCALALTRMHQGAPLAQEILRSPDGRWRRLAALALAEAGDPSGAPVLIGWWQDAKARDYERSRELLAALGRIREKDAVWPLVQSLDDVRLRPYIASTLAAIGEESARGPLAHALAEERYQSARTAIAKALVQLGAEYELALPLTRFLGVPDPLPDGVGYAIRAGILEHIGGPDNKGLRALTRDAGVGVQVVLTVPRGGNGRGLRVIVRARNESNRAAAVYVGARGDPVQFDSEGKLKNTRKVPRIDPKRSVSLRIPPTKQVVEAYAQLPAGVGRVGEYGLRLVVFAERDVVVEGLAVVPLADELPPPPPQPWHARAGSDSGAEGG